ncbi:hypothetical protein F1640_14920 [Novosphingobium sp. NBM11]|uniref:hypothetical protein n=1 Tax=Novosphingobium sp. NBM11 TaxID=2596914 RepID=UPI001892170D|nr:hypothetical protein [Novosphingobium sp. NBM11]MBF5091279.1 hypothetical protein [Novosphingobium sp. NBM11]
MGSDIPSIKFDKSRVSEDIKKALYADINGLPYIPTQLREALYGAALESISKGRDLALLTRWLVEQDVPGIDKGQASAIARFLNNRATVRMRINREASNGISESIWIHSGAPCLCPNAAEHLRANGTRYGLRDGLLINGVPSWPGMDEGCKCTWKAVIPGF